MLIHAAAGGSGSAAIQLAVNAGRASLRDGRVPKRRCSCAGSSAPTSPSTTRRATSPRSCWPRPPTAASTSSSTTSARQSWTTSLKCTRVQRPLPDDGLRLQQGGGRREVPRAPPHRAGNIKLCGVLLAYVLRDGREDGEDRAWAGTSSPIELGAERSPTRSSSSCVAKKVKPVVGRVVAFEEIPAAIEAMANRETVGRTIVKLY